MPSDKTHRFGILHAHFIPLQHRPPDGLFVLGPQMFTGYEGEKQENDRPKIVSNFLPILAGLCKRTVRDSGRRHTSMGDHQSSLGYARRLGRDLTFPHRLILFFFTGPTQLSETRSFSHSTHANSALTRYSWLDRAQQHVAQPRAKLPPESLDGRVWRARAQGGR